MSAPVSCCLSAAGVGLLDRPVPARDLGLPHGRLTSDRWTRTGIPRSARVSYGRVGCLLYPGTGGVRTADKSATAATAAFQRPVLHPATTSHPRGHL